MLPILLSIVWFITFMNQSGVYHNIQVTVPSGCTESTVGYGWATLINYVLPNGTAYVGGVYYVENYVACPSQIGSPGTGVGFTQCTSSGYGLSITCSLNAVANVQYCSASVSYPIALAPQNGTKSLVYPSTWWYYLFNTPGYVQGMVNLYNAWPFGPLNYYPCFVVTTIPASNPNTEYTWYYYPVATKVYVGKQQYIIYTTTPNKLGPFPSLPFTVPTPIITGLGVSPINQSVPVGAYAVVNITEYGNAYIPPTLVFAGSQYCMYMPHIGLTEDMPGRYNGTVSVAGYIANFTIAFYQPTVTTTSPTAPSTTPTTTPTSNTTATRTGAGVSKPVNYALIAIIATIIIIAIAAIAYVITRRRHGRGGVRI